MTEFKGCKGYTLLSTEKLDDVNIIAYTLRHDKTGARIVLLANDDDNKSFIIGFKTPQSDSTGVPHILEHAVLCGSEKYPVKDAMTEVSKGSLNTFLNAFTYPDRTLYPTASCNDKDFQNLMSVYLDAVFYPRVLKEEKIFKQEGWHYEMEDADSPISINGVVYNEMKGVYSSPDQALSSYIMFSLFPDTQYGVESGGDPDEIPNLSYEDFCAFYRKLYHPSNSRILLYGDMDFEEKLKFIDTEYLSRFDRIEVDSEVKLQAPFKERKRVEKEYGILESDDDKDSTFLSYNVVCTDYTDVKTIGVMSAINYALCSVPGAKLKERLLDAGIGKDVYSDYTTDTCQKVFSIIAQDANPEDEERFVQIIEDTIKEIIEEGFDKKTLLASIVSSEFSYREADYGYYPKGIAYGSLAFENWLYSDDDIFSFLKQNEVYKELREGIDSGLFEKVLKEKVLDNNHKTVLVMKPKKGYTEKKEDELKNKLKLFKESLSKEDIDKIVKETQALEAYQTEGDSKEALDTIPTLSIADIKKEITPCEYTISEILSVKEIFTELQTNGIVYFKLCFNADRIPRHLHNALSVLKSLLGYLDTKSFTYGDLVNECNIRAGALYTSVFSYGNYFETDNYTSNLEVRVKSFYRNVPECFELINEILLSSKIDDKKRVKENLEQSKVRILGYMMQSGHSVAIQTAAASVSDAAAYNEAMFGMAQYRYLEKILKNFDDEFEKLKAEMREVLDLLLTKDNLEVSVGCDKEGKMIFDKELISFILSLKEKAPVNPYTHIKKTKKSTAFTYSSQVQYACRFGNYKESKKYEYNGSLQVLRSILNTDYLWNEVRLKGGAYGCFCNFSTNGDSFMVSYRDPNLSETYEVYDDSADYVENLQLTKEDVERYIISTIGEYDTPMTPSTKIARSYVFYKNGVDNAIKQKERDEILSTTVEKLKSLAPLVREVLDNSAYSCVGSETKLKEEGKYFDIIEPLSNNS